MEQSMVREDNGTHMEWYYDVSYSPAITRIKKYYIPLIVVVGLIGNAVIGVVYMFTPLKRKPSSTFLVSLAVADSCFLVNLVSHYVLTFVLHYKNEDLPCRLINYLETVTSGLSVWYTVGYTIERYIAVKSGFRLATLCTPKRTRLTITCLLLFLACFYLYIFFAFIEACRPNPRHQAILRGFLVADSILSFAVPFSTILMLNILIICHLRQSKTFRRQATFCEDTRAVTSRSPTYYECMTSRSPLASPTSEPVTSLCSLTEKDDDSDSCGEAQLPLDDSLPPKNEKNDIRLEDCCDVQEESVTTRHQPVHTSSVQRTCLSAQTSNNSRIKASVTETLYDPLSNGTYGNTGPSLRRLTLSRSQTSSIASTSKNRCSTTIMLIATSSVFLLLHFPCHLLRFLHAISNHESGHLVQLIDIFNHLYLLHFSINFIIYCLCGSSFRCKTKELFVQMSRRCAQRLKNSYY